MRAKKIIPASFRRYFSLENCYITKKNTICNSVSDYLKIYFKKIYLTKVENN